MLKSSTRRTQTGGIFVKQVVFHTVNHHGPLPLKELHSTGETIVWRDPGGSWACLLPVYDCVWNHPATGCDMWTTPQKHIMKRQILGNANQNKTTRRAGYKKVYEPPPPFPLLPKEAFRIKGAWWNAEQNKKTNNNSWIEESYKKKAQKWTSQTGKEPYENNSEKNRALKTAKKNKTTKKKSSDRRPS